MSIEVVAALIGLSGTVAAAILTLVGVRAANLRQELDQRAAAAYVDLIGAMAKSPHVGDDPSRRAEALAAAADAKARIAMFGRADVAAALARPERDGGFVGSNGDHQAALLDALELIQRHFKHPDMPSRDTVSNLLFGGGSSDLPTSRMQREK